MLQKARALLIELKGAVDDVLGGACGIWVRMSDCTSPRILESSVVSKRPQGGRCIS